MDKSQIFHRDFFILLFTNLFVINMTGFMLIALIFYLQLYSLINSISSNDISESVIFVICLILSIFFSFTLHKLLLPLIYSFLEIKSKNIYVQQFIINLKSSWKWKLGILLFGLICQIIEYNIYIVSFSPLQFMMFLLISGFSNYIFLFFWWEVEKFIIRKNKIQRI